MDNLISHSKSLFPSSFGSLALSEESVGASSYMRRVNNAPILSSEEELKLAERFRIDGDLEAARMLVLSHLRYVVKVARGFMGYGLPLMDLIQEGSVGLMKAVKRYNPERGVRLVSFAMHWIRAEIYEYVVRNWRMVKIATTKAHRKLFFNLRKNKERLGWMTQDEHKALANNLSLDVSEVRDMEKRLHSSDVSFDAPINQDDSIESIAPADYLGDNTYDPSVLVERKGNSISGSEAVKKALSALDDRSRSIVQRRWLEDNKPKLKDLAQEYGISAERVRQIEEKAFDKMRTALSL